MTQLFYKESGIELYCGDCRDILPNLPRGLTVTDPPYNVGYHYEGYEDKLSTEDYQELIRSACPLPCVVIHYPEDLCAVSWTLEEIPERIVAWVYNSNTPRQWRGIAWFGVKPDFTLAGQAYKNPTDKRVAVLIEQGRESRLYDWWEIDQVKNVGKEKTAHPCQIPLKVMKRILQITPSDLIIDSFAGSGTTLLAAKQLGRKCIGIELSEKYCSEIVERLRQSVLPL